MSLTWPKNDIQKVQESALVKEYSNSTLLEKLKSEVKQNTKE